MDANPVPDASSGPELALALTAAGELGLSPPGLSVDRPLAGSPGTRTHAYQTDKQHTHTHMHACTILHVHTLLTRAMLRLRMNVERPASDC